MRLSACSHVAGRRTFTECSLRFFKGDRLGVTTMEFALLVPVFFAMLLTIVEAANLYRVHNEMSAAVRDGGRRVAVGAMAPSEAILLVQSRVAAISDAPVNVTVVETPFGESRIDITVAADVSITDALMFDYFQSSGDLTKAAIGDAEAAPDTTENTGATDETAKEGNSMRMTASATMMKE